MNQTDIMSVRRCASLTHCCSYAATHLPSSTVTARRASHGQERSAHRTLTDDLVPRRATHLALRHGGSLCLFSNARFALERFDLSTQASAVWDAIDGARDVSAVVAVAERAGVEDPRAVLEALHEDHLISTGAAPDEVQ